MILDGEFYSTVNQACLSFRFLNTYATAVRTPRDDLWDIPSLMNPESVLVVVQYEYTCGILLLERW